MVEQARLHGPLLYGACIVRRVLLEVCNVIWVPRFVSGAVPMSAPRAVGGGDLRRA